MDKLSTPSRVTKYILVRAAWLAAMVFLSIFLSVIVINYGGYIDQIYRAQVDEALLGFGRAGGFKDVPVDQIAALQEKMRVEMETALGLNEPFLGRCLRWTWQAIRLDLGESTRISALKGTTTQRSDVRSIILQRLPNTLLLSGTTNLVIFFVSVLLALMISRKHGNWLDKLMVALSPLSAAPSWVYGVILIVIFAAQLHWLPFDGMYDDRPPATQLGYIPIVLKHMILPAAAIALSTLFQSVYAWRTFFLLHTEDDHVEMARAKGLTPAQVEKDYILRPTLPYLVTSFALLMISFWQSAIALERLFGWPGIGAVLVEAVRSNDRRVTIGIITLFAFILAVTMFLLDLVYAFIDPRVRIESQSQRTSPVQWHKRLRLRFSRKGLHAPAGIQPAPRWTENLAKKKRLSLPFALRKFGQNLLSMLRQIMRFPSAGVGLILVLLLAILAIYTIIAIPYDQAVALWLGKGTSWDRNPRNASPAWTNLFRREKLPETIILDSRIDAASKTWRQASPEMREITILFAIDYPYGGFPQDIMINLKSQYTEKRPLIVLTWITPDGREIELESFSMTSDRSFYISQDKRLQRKLGDHPLQAIFADPSLEKPVPLKGTYHLGVSGFVFEENADLEVEAVLFGQVHGWAGTDHRRRDLSLALMWGAPVALTFGLGGAVLTSFLAMLLAAMGAWFGGWVDNVIQRITEINMVVPALPLAIMIYYLYSKSVWAILGVMVILNIFSSAIKNYRAVFLQVKEAPYIEAAQAYGTGDARMIVFYLVPRILPVLVPQMVILVPGFVFLEATLSFLGVSDPFFPTWGKVIYDALENGAYRGYYYWLLEPVALLLLTGLAFALIGFALERLFNPRLREV